MPRSSLDEEAFRKLSLVQQFDEVIRTYKVLTESSCEKEFLQFAQHFEACCKKWNSSEYKCAELQEKLTKSEAEKNALMIKLKHARRQIEVEMRGRQQAEQDRDELSQQIALVRELLLSDTPSGTLSEEQQRKLDFLNASRFQSPRGSSRAARRLDPIDETGSMLSDYSDISFDVTEDDLDGSHLRNGKRWKRGRLAVRRACVDDDHETLPKRVKADIAAHESLHCTVDGPATMCIEKLEKSFTKPNPHQGRRRPSREHRRRSATTSESETQSEVETFWPKVPTPSMRTMPTSRSANEHKLQMKPCVITKETCKPCGKRIQFGKKALKCVDCRLVVHPECEDSAKSYVCNPAPTSPSAASEKNTLEQFLASDKAPQIPPIVYHTVQEIERRGLNETGLYRVPGMLKTVKELREKFKGKSIPKLTEVGDIHTLCSLVKDFLRVQLKEPILTFELRPKFIEAARKEIDTDMYSALYELKDANRDTLMFIILHFQRIIATPETRMSEEALAKAVGPSVVGYASAEPSLDDVQSAAADQEQVLRKLLQLPAEYFSKMLEKVMLGDTGTPRVERKLQATPDRYRKKDAKKNTIYGSTSSLHKAPESLLGPVGSPGKTPSSSSLAERAKKYLGGTPFGRGKRKDASYFASPSLH
ncbi:rac GTPase-activating protein 1-like isoform X2 [Clavelina lepadiformis]|uniref:Rac GTPase-activating protein 1 n=1 Tax=Clavelina lepadiformis TaxID=159417 RepID=A0ABP0GT60_CLALP